MSQDFSTLVTDITTMGTLYGILNASLAALRSQFSGTSAPADPVQGQMFFNTDTSRDYQWDGSAWVDVTEHMPAFKAVETEVEDARGSAASVDARISVAINPDGTLKGDAPATGWWTEESETPSYDTALTLTLPGDLTAVYTARRAVRLTQTADDQGHVVSSSYNGGGDVTTVTVTCAVDAGLSLVEYGQEVGNQAQEIGYRRGVGLYKYDDDTFGIRPGWIEIDGLVCQVPEGLTKAHGITAATLNEVYGLMSKPASGNVISASDISIVTTAPARDGLRGGYYTGDARGFGWWVVDASDDLIDAELDASGNRIDFDSAVVLRTTFPSVSTWYDCGQSSSVPYLPTIDGAIAVLDHNTVSNSQGYTLSVRKKGTSGSGKVVARGGANAYRASGDFSAQINSDGDLQVMYGTGIPDDTHEVLVSAVIVEW